MALLLDNVWSRRSLKKNILSCVVPVSCPQNKGYERKGVEIENGMKITGCINQQDF